MIFGITYPLNPSLTAAHLSQSVRSHNSASGFCLIACTVLATTCRIGTARITACPT
ncbi:MAG: hypothetical protein R6W69_11805 [Anaerolineales bacterium]